MRKPIAGGLGLFLLAACQQASDEPGAAGPAGDPAEAVPLAAAAGAPPAFAQCRACHQVEAGKHGIGPSLAGVFGANAAHLGDFAYSPALRQSGLNWNEETLHAYLANPREAVPGTRMSYAGLRDEAQRQAVIDYLKAL